MKDRISANPGRRLVTPEGGAAPYYATIERADNPIEAGTPLNKGSLLNDSAGFVLGSSTVNEAIVQGINFDNLASFPGTQKITSFPTGKMLETLTFTGSGVTIATRELSFSTFVTTEIFYANDGSILRQRSIAKTFPSGTIKDVIT